MSSLKKVSLIKWFADIGTPCNVHTLYQWMWLWLNQLNFLGEYLYSIHRLIKLEVISELGWLVCQTPLWWLEWEVSPVDSDTWIPAPQKVVLFREVVQPCWGKYITGRWTLRVHSLSRFCSHSVSCYWRPNCCGRNVLAAVPHLFLLGWNHSQNKSFLL